MLPDSWDSLTSPAAQPLWLALRRDTTQDSFHSFRASDGARPQGGKECKEVKESLARPFHQIHGAARAYKEINEFGVSREAVERTR
jgi:hypothetical protein